MLYDALHAYSCLFHGAGAGRSTSPSAHTLVEPEAHLAAIGPAILMLAAALAVMALVAAFRELQEEGR